MINLTDTSVPAVQVIQVQTARQVSYLFLESVWDDSWMIFKMILRTFRHFKKLSIHRAHTHEFKGNFR